MRCALPLCFALLSSAVFAQSGGVAGALTRQPGGPAWTREAELAPASPRRAEILANFARGRHGTMLGVGGVPISWARFVVAPERAAIVLVTGRTESWWKYPELVFDLNRRGYSLYVIDHRGQGFSGRLLGKDRPPTDPEYQKQYVGRFDDYVRDLERFVRQVVRRVPHRRVFAIGHSLGGGILTRLLEERPGIIDAAVTCSPMNGLPLNRLQEWAVALMDMIGLGKRYALGAGPRSPDEWKFRGNLTTTSLARYELKKERWEPIPRIWTEGPTWHWVHDALRATRLMRRDAWRITTPLLVIQGGADVVVANSGSDVVAAKARCCTKVVIEGGRHELLMEADQMRDETLDRIAAFFAAQEQLSRAR